MVLVSYQLFIIIGPYRLFIWDFELAVVRRLFHAGLHDILLMQGERFCRKVQFLGKIQKLGVRNSRTYRPPNSRKSNFATELLAASAPRHFPRETAALPGVLRVRAQRAQARENVAGRAH